MEIEHYVGKKPMDQRKPQEKLGTILRQIKAEHHKPKLMGCSENSAKGDIYSYKSLP